MLMALFLWSVAVQFISTLTLLFVRLIFPMFDDMFDLLDYVAITFNHQLRNSVIINMETWP